MIDVLSALEPIEPIAGRLAEVSPVPLALGIALQLLKLGTLSRVWLQIVRAALPDTRIRARDAVVPYLAGAGADAVLPAKAGLATRIVLARRRIPEASYETLAGTLAAEGLVGIPPMLVLLAAAVAAGILPGALGGSAIGAPSWLAAPLAWIVGAAAVAVLATACLAARPVRRRAAVAAARARRGMRIVSGGPALAGALVGEAVAVVLRLGSIACFLAAFGLAPTPRLVVLVVLAQVLASVVPIAPGGAGAQQGLLVVVLARVSSAGAALAFGVGMQAAVIVADVGAGLAAVALVGGAGALARAAARPRRRPAAAESLR